MITSDDIWHHDEARTWHQSHQAFQELPENNVNNHFNGLYQRIWYTLQ